MSKVSKNARTSKPKEFIKSIKEKPKNLYRLIELTSNTYNNLKKSEDISSYTDENGKIYEIKDIISHYGKTYLRLIND